MVLSIIKVLHNNRCTKSRNALKLLDESKISIGVSSTYDYKIRIIGLLNGIYIPEKPWPSWQFNRETGWWNAPIPRPNDGSEYYWDEVNLKWLTETEFFEKLLNNK